MGCRGSDVGLWWERRWDTVEAMPGRGGRWRGEIAGGNSGGKCRGEMAGGNGGSDAGARWERPRSTVGKVFGYSGRGTWSCWGAVNDDRDKPRGGPVIQGGYSLSVICRRCRGTKAVT